MCRKKFKYRNTNFAILAWLRENYAIGRAKRHRRQARRRESDRTIIGIQAVDSLKEDRFGGTARARFPKTASHPARGAPTGLIEIRFKPNSLAFKSHGVGHYGPVVGFKVDGRPSITHDSKATGDAEADASNAAYRSASLRTGGSSVSAVGIRSEFRRPTHLARRVANLNRRRGSSYRTFPPRPAIVAVPGGRRGEAPGRRTSRRVPASPSISAGGRYESGERPALCRFGRVVCHAHSPVSSVHRPGSRQRNDVRRVRPACPASGTQGTRPPPPCSTVVGARVPPDAFRAGQSAPHSVYYHILTAVGRTPGPQRSRPCDRPRRRPAPGRTGARTHASPRTRVTSPVGRAPAGRGSTVVAGRGCCKTEIPG
ncbi:hypothetical protein ACI65C_012979 [Semiaphis heraclei]